MDLLSQLVRAIQGGQPQARPATRQAARAQGMTPAQRDFPGRTNYGVPEDNMIDTPQGYVTPEQYNQMMGGGKQFKMYEDRSFQGDPRAFLQANPGFKFYEDGSFAPPRYKTMGVGDLHHTNAASVMPIADEGGAMSPQIQVGSATDPMQGGSDSYRGLANPMQRAARPGMLQNLAQRNVRIRY